MNQPIQRGRTDAVLVAEFIAKQSRRLAQIMNQSSAFRHNIRGVMIDHEPVRLVQTRFKIEIANPRGFLPHIAHFPAL